MKEDFETCPDCDGCGVLMDYAPCSTCNRKGRVPVIRKSADQVWDEYVDRIARRPPSREMTVREMLIRRA